MSQFIIEIEDAALETRTKKDNSGTYQMQTGYAHTVDRQGNPNRYPEKIVFFPPRDNQGNAIALKVGKYYLGPGSFRIANNGQLEIGFIDLLPIK